MACHSVAERGSDNVPFTETLDKATQTVCGLVYFNECLKTKGDYNRRKRKDHGGVHFIVYHQLASSSVDTGLSC